MIKNITILKKYKLYFVSALIPFFLSSCNKKYNKGDITEIIKTTLMEFSIENNLKMSIEFAPRLERNISDKQFLENNFLLTPSNSTISREDIDFMLQNKNSLSKQKLSDYISCFNKCIYTDPYFKGDQKIFKDVVSFIRVTRPYISINTNFAIIGYGIYNKFSFSRGYFLLSKNESKWKIIRKVSLQ